MRIWIDTEFNDFKGDLISIALVAEDGHEFYESVGCENPGQWVAENVMPKINKEPIPLELMQFRMRDFLMQFESVHIVADWPEDIAYFCDLLIFGPGLRFDTPPLTIEIRRDLDATSLLPHNALADARAIMRKHLELEIA